MKNRDSLPSLREAVRQSKLLSTSAGSHGSFRHQSSMFRKSDIDFSYGDTPGGDLPIRMSMPVMNPKAYRFQDELIPNEENELQSFQPNAE